MNSFSTSLRIKTALFEKTELSKTRANLPRIKYTVQIRQKLREQTRAGSRDSQMRQKAQEDPRFSPTAEMPSVATTLLSILVCIRRAVLHLSRSGSLNFLPTQRYYHSSTSQRHPFLLALVVFCLSIMNLHSFIQLDKALNWEYDKSTHPDLF